MREKLAEYSSEGFGWPLSAAILDPVRLSLVCCGPSQIVQVAKWFTEQLSASNVDANQQEISIQSLPVVRIKNKFAYDIEALKGGYRDLMLSVLYEDPESHLRIIGEIQVVCIVTLCSALASQLMQSKLNRFKMGICLT